MRSLEHGKSMPSGDSTAAAYFTGIYLFTFGFPYITIVVLPLVMLARVYVFCHWIGDTLAGAMLGLTYVYFTFSTPYFTVIAYPLFNAIV